jgi:16S rRNA (cytidine1402-2'-O)-methyltransferase
LVRAAAGEGFDVRSVPGACAAIAALSIGALPTDRFCFEGFLAARGAARRRHLESLQDETRTMVLYESPHRIADTLADCVQAFGAARAATLVRETTKLHESVYRGSLGELAAAATADQHMERGEMVLLIAGAPPPDRAHSDALLDRALQVLLPEMPLKQAARLAAHISGARDNEAYKRALILKGG